jgi:hypothetical protein
MNDDAQDQAVSNIVILKNIEDIHQNKRQATMKEDKCINAYRVKKQPIKISIRVKSASSGYFMGYEDLINNRLHTTSVKCYSKEGTLYQIFLKDF